MFTVGVTMSSFEENETVIVSPSFALDVVAALSDSMCTDDSVGAVKSIVTRLVSVTDVSVVPTLPAISWNPTERLALPSSSKADTEYTAEYEDALTADTLAGDPAIVTAGGMMSSLAVIESVMVSPAFARDVSAALSDEIVTADKVGTVRSSTTTRLSVTDVTESPLFPAKS